MIIRTSLLAILLVCSGCIPVRWADTPHIAGVVLDGQNQQPIVGARLYYTNFPPHEVYTSTTGQFDFPRISHWGCIVLLPVDRIPPVANLSIEARGYASTNILLWAWPDRTNAVFYLSHE